MSGKRNPPWTRDELIIALDLYFELQGKVPGATHPRIIEVSQILNSLPDAPRLKGNDSFRNPNGVGKKLWNFGHLDPDNPRGLPNGGKLDKVIWDEFHNDRKKLHEEAQQLINLTLSTPPEDTSR